MKKKSFSLNGIAKSINNVRIHAIHPVESEGYSSEIMQTSNHAAMQTSVAVGDTAISINPNYYRPNEVACPFGNLLIGDSTKAKKELGWEARQTKWRVNKN